MACIGKLVPKSITLLALFLIALPSIGLSKQIQDLDIYIWSVDKTRLKPAMKTFSPKQVKVSATYDSKEDNGDSAKYRVTFSRALKLMERKVDICFLNVKKTRFREKIASYNKHPVFFFSLPELMILKSQKNQYASEVDLKELVQKEQVQIGVISDISYDPRLSKLAEQHPQSFYIREGSHQLGTIFDMIRHKRLDATLVFSSWLRVQHRAGNYLDFISLPIKGINQPEPGYLLCSDTPAGNQVIDDFDREYFKNDVEGMVIKNANQRFKPKQVDYIEEVLKGKKIIAPE